MSSCVHSIPTLDHSVIVEEQTTLNITVNLKSLALFQAEALSNIDTPTSEESISSSEELPIQGARLNAAALSDSNSLFIPLTAPGVTGPIRTLVDSGSTHCFIDSAFARTFALERVPVGPIWLCLFDGTSNSVITDTCELPVEHSNGVVTPMQFLCTRLDGQTHMVLGHNWLRKYNPQIDWQHDEITFQPCVWKSESTRKGWSRPSETKARAAHLPFQDTPSIAIISALAFAMAAKADGSHVYQMSLSHVVEARLALVGVCSSEPILSLPSEYAEFADVFSKE